MWTRIRECVRACVRACERACATFVLLVLPVDVDQDQGVAAGHGQQGDDIERDKVEHVVEGLLPALGEAAVRNTLCEVDPVRLHRPEYKQLGDKTFSGLKVQIINTYHVVVCLVSHTILYLWYHTPCYISGLT